MKKLFCLGIACLFGTLFFSCNNNSDTPILLATASGIYHHSESTNFLPNWENQQFLYINDTSRLNTEIGAPWNTEAAQTLIPDNIRFDVKSADGWEVAFNLMNKEGYPDINYFGLYNKYSGVLRIFYYYNKEVASSATDFAFDVILGTDGAKNPAYYNTLNYGIPMEAEVNPSVNLLGAGTENRTFHLLITPYSCIDRHTMSQGWYAFDIDMSAYTGKSFCKSGSGIHIACRAGNKTSVSLGTEIVGTLGGGISLESKQASSNGVSGTLADLSGWQSNVASALKQTGDAAASGNPISAAGAAMQWVSSIFNFASILTKEDEQPLKMTGKVDLKLNATANTKGYLESEVSTNVMQFALGKSAFNPDSNIGKGVWNIDKSPEIYFISDRIISEDYTSGWYVDLNRNIFLHPDQKLYFLGGKNCRLPYFYDPSSFTVSLNRDAFPDASNIQVLTYCGIYEQNNNNNQNTTFRTVLGLGNLETKGLALPKVTNVGTDDWGTYYDYDQNITRKFFAVHTEEEYAQADLKFDGFTYKRYGNNQEFHYYGQELSSGGSLGFIMEPQIYYAQRYDDISGDFKIPSRLPELYVVVCVKFDSGGKHFYFSRTFLPKVSEIKYEEAKAKVAEIKTRLDSQADKIYKDEYKASLDKKMEFLNTN